MSSIADKRSTFFRSSSIEKLKCTASLLYPLQLAGIKFTKESQKYFSGKSIIVRSRTHLYRSYLATSNGFAEILCTVLVWLLDLLAKFSVINKSVAAEITYKYKIKQKKLLIRKRKQESLIYIKNYDTEFIKKIDTNLTATTTTSINKNCDDKLLLNEKINNNFDNTEENLDLLLFNDDLNLNKLFEQTNLQKQTAKLLNEKNKQKFYSILAKIETEKLNNSSRKCEIVQSSSILNKNNNNNNFILKYSLYACILLIYIKFHILCTMLLNSNPPPGLLFMISNLCIIGGIVIQIFYAPNKITTIKSSNSIRKIVEVKHSL